MNIEETAVNSIKTLLRENGDDNILIGCYKGEYDNFKVASVRFKDNGFKKLSNEGKMFFLKTVMG